MAWNIYAELNRLPRIDAVVSCSTERWPSPVRGLRRLFGNSRAVEDSILIPSAQNNDNLTRPVIEGFGRLVLGRAYVEDDYQGMFIELEDADFVGLDDVAKWRSQNIDALAEEIVIS